MQKQFSFWTDVIPKIAFFFNCEKVQSLSWPVGESKISYIFQCAFLGNSPFLAGLKFPPIPSIIRSDYCKARVFSAFELSERLLTQLPIIVVLLHCCTMKAKPCNSLWKLFSLSLLVIFCAVKSNWDWTIFLLRIFSSEFYNRISSDMKI